jgi:hypothetical protein
MIRKLDEILEAFKGEAARIRCFAHTLNLIVKVRILYLFSCIIFSLIIDLGYS